MPTAPGLGRSALAVAAALAITVCGAASAAADTAPPDGTTPSPERVAAMVHPALVRVTGTFVGVVHNGQGSYANNGRPYTVTFTCSGFGVHPDGYLASVGHCVDANDPFVREGFVEAAAEEVVAGRTDVTLERMIEYGRSAWVVEGPASGSPVESEIRVTGIAGAPPDGLLARVVDDRPVGQGDVALLKVDTTGLPALELATGGGLTVGTPLLAAGYPQTVGEVVEPDARPSIEDGAVTGTRTEGGRPMYEIDAPLELGMSGGPAVDHSGRVLGINTAGVIGTQPINLVVPISGFTELLDRNGVHAELGPRDLRYREALDAHDAGEYTDAIDAIDRLQHDGPLHPRIAEVRGDAESARAQHGDASENRLAQILVWVGAAVGVVVVVITVLLVVRRRRRRTPVVLVGPPLPPLPPFPPQGGHWQGRPGAPFPAPAPHPAAGDARNHPYAPARYGPPAAPRAPFAAPARPAPQAPPSGEGPTRQLHMRPPAPPAAPADAERAGGPDHSTTRIAAPTPPAAGNAGDPAADLERSTKEEGA